MGKETVVIYTCDLCGSESRDEFHECKCCKKDYCDKCSGYIKLYAEKRTGEEKSVLIDQGKPMCKECAENYRIEFNVSPEKASFSVSGPDN